MTDRLKKSGRLVTILTILALSLYSCKQEEKLATARSEISGMATPVYLSPDGGEILLSDYFTDTTLIDSIENNAGYTTHLSEDKQKLKIEPGEELGYVSNLRIWAKGTVNDIPLYKSTREKVKFSFPDPDKKHSSVMIKGQFNGWVPERSEMTYENGAWTYEAGFNPGAHQYLMVIDGKESLDPTNPEKVSNGMGGMNSVLTVGSEAEKARITPLKIKKKGFSLKLSEEINEIFVYVNNILAVHKKGKLENNVEIDLPSAYEGRSLLRIYAYNENGRTNDLLFPLEDGKVVTDASLLKRSDFHTQIMYFLMVDRFKDGDKSNTKAVDSDEILPIANHFGGDLQGVTDKINEGYFEDLGVNTIWLSPITQNPEGAYGLWPEPKTKFSGYHGYWPISNTKIDWRFGDKKVFKELLKKAHDRNMNVILDYVANHVHEEHPLYQEHKDWATDLYLPDGTMNTEKWDSHRLTTWFDTFLPTLDFSKPEVVEKMTDSAAFWVTDYELDGFRHDATKHIQEEFWRTLTKKIKSRTDRPIYQVGETYGSYELIRSYINTGMLDAQFDFNLYDAAVNAFARTDTDFEQLANTLEQGLEYYDSNHLMGNITGNQDRARFISYASGDVRFDEDAKVAGWTRDIEITDSTAYKKLEMLHAFNLSVPGVPCIYYGDEYGSPGGNDPDNRRMMKFEGLSGKESALKNAVKELIAKRRNSMALLYGTTEILQADEALFVLKRSYFGEEAIAIFNKSAEAVKLNYFDSEVTVAPGSYKLIFNK
ncbi:alpha-amylase [Leptobacterium flavescens]|uniref:Alpha-amylase n=1 Tax=Leptobacterium flavescens TaxID=472055 RepID=A0A6P0UNA8_9FLAO|nr:alpha-amylase family glycosyl hydrolase [Leptobacterium flavescens]NER14655.1 alpha-amylase [Leptobacterium flavescens]